MVGVADEFGSQLFQELDYIAEGQNAVRFKELYGSIPGIYVPSINFDLTSRYYSCYITKAYATASASYAAATATTATSTTTVTAQTCANTGMDRCDTMAELQLFIIAPTAAGIIFYTTTTGVRALAH
eukprot:21320-Heterococcus_DN1.PRE.4